MPIKITRDPAGLLPDQVHINFKPGYGKKEVEALRRRLDAATPSARIERLRRHAALRSLADDLAAELGPNGSADLGILHDISRAEKKALYLDAAPKVIAANNSRNGPAKKNAKRKAEADARHAEWQRLADPIWRKFPRQTAGWIAERIRAELDRRREPGEKLPAVNVIRQALKRPRT